MVEAWWAEVAAEIPFLCSCFSGARVEKSQRLEMITGGCTPSNLPFHLLHVALAWDNWLHIGINNAPEFETVQETREKLQERRKFIAKATSKREWLVTEKDQGQNLTASEYSEPSSQPGRSNTSISSETPYSCFAHSFELPSSCSISQNPVTAIPAYVGNWPSESTANNSQAASSADIDQWKEHNMIAPTPGPQRKEPSNKGIGRFIPRTTLLEERKRRRDQDTAFHLTGASMDNTEVIIGPLLPEIPNVDMDDESLNVSANAIRNKLKEVSSIPVLKSERAEEENSQRAPPLKQRRRI
uniref:RNA-binding protein 48-like n=1 Tax=Geotrypetes seraphini TaxID=260995 RepID=A0A6P8PVI3_GEOSA|nr:RNA-binding protein 48-like [Geotrypetes seraphini]